MRATNNNSRGAHRESAAKRGRASRERGQCGLGVSAIVFCINRSRAFRGVHWLWSKDIQLIESLARALKVPNSVVLYALNRKPGVVYKHEPCRKPAIIMLE